MTEVSSRNFGLLIAYMIPGFVLVWTISGYSETVQSWLGAIPREAPTVGGFLYVTLASVAAGMFLSAIRWLTLDFVHRRTGVPQPSWDISTLPGNLAAFEILVEYHYRYYQFYGNLLIAVLIAGVARIGQFNGSPLKFALSLLGFVVFVAILFIASRNALQNYYARTNVLLSRRSHVPTATRDNPHQETTGRHR